ncbi:MAG: 50S ribosomal protein L23 [Methanomethylovorans sp.]|jgi:large subunit ribosomal protein L23|nr:50S ribosomal protein L23 [Methanomethylovorans sp.]
MTAINYPFITEKAMNLLENNKLQFIVNRKATKGQIKSEVMKMYGFKVSSVSTMSTMKGQKKAIVTFSEKDAAHEIATRIGLM